MTRTHTSSSLRSSLWEAALIKFCHLKMTNLKGSLHFYEAAPLDCLEVCATLKRHFEKLHSAKDDEYDYALTFLDVAFAV